MPVEPTGLEALLQTYFTGQQSPGLGPRFRQLRRNWADVKCFSCGKTGHSANRCPKLDVTFPFILPGWKSEKTPNGYLMIFPMDEWQWTAAGRKTKTDPEGGVRLSDQL